MDVTAGIVEDRMEEAARTLRRLPNPSGSGARGYGSSWPDFVRDPRQAYGYGETRMRVVPSAADIAQMEECLDLLRVLSAEDARIVWMRAEGWRWKNICIQIGVVRQTAWRRWVAGLITIANHLNEKAKPEGRSKPARKKTGADRVGKTAGGVVGTLL